jgi:hypothetical protein
MTRRTIGHLTADDTRLVTAFDGLPQVDFPANLHAAMAAGRRMTSILADDVSLRRGPGRLAPAEFFLCRSWHKKNYLDYGIMPRTVAET